MKRKRAAKAIVQQPDAQLEFRFLSKQPAKILQA
jgi:hypothetical protein